MSSKINSAFNWRNAHVLPPTKIFTKVLEAVGDPSGGIILLISDGEEKVEPFIKDLKDDIIDAGVIVDTLAFTQLADGGLTDLAQKTGKRWKTRGL